MTKAAQMRVSALLKARWGANVAITHQRDGALVACIHYADGMSVIEVEDENSHVLRHVGCIGELSLVPRGSPSGLRCLWVLCGPESQSGPLTRHGHPSTPAQTR